MELMQISDCSKSDSPTICELLKLGLKELRQESQLPAAPLHSMFPFFLKQPRVYIFIHSYISLTLNSSNARVNAATFYSYFGHTVSRST